MADTIIKRVDEDEFHRMLQLSAENRRNALVIAWYDDTVSNVFKDIAEIFKTEITEVSLEEFTNDAMKIVDILARVTGYLPPSQFAIIGITHMRDGMVISYANDSFMMIYGRDENNSYLAYISSNERYVIMTKSPTNILITD